ncbi:hypothetical protein AGMMS49543_18470 [Betaproteobacteria bacterium]|nr:hypothetical protein AGMMS49543_18470 [Betaproteobacteria bacterium]GHU22188.1 hypothetical protein AGMMS50243_21290 [Betaproteobacteria bacterium]GHU24473.1 hypothetical protein FACS189488_09210 [Betaproteobacteria bacterium]
MHPSSLQNMTRFRAQYLHGREAEPLRILDLGATAYDGCYRPVFAGENWHYLGVDLAPGDNVDLVLQEPYRWDEIASDSIDVFVSGQVLEHAEYFWITMLEISRVLKPGGLACIIVPSAGPEHRFPLDCWRFYTDGMKAMARFGRLAVLDAYTQWQGVGDGHPWNDSVLVAQKPLRPWWKRLGIRALQSLQRRMMTIGLIRSV